MAKVKRSLIHLNGHQLCAVDCETTGLRAGYHEIIQVSMLPLDAWFEPYAEISPLDLILRPEYPHRADDEAIRKVGKDRFDQAVKSGLPQEKGLEIFEDWLMRMPIPEGKRLVPVAHNWPFDSNFLRVWMGYESHNQYYDSRVRDTMQVASYLNDRADFAGDTIPFPKNLQLSTLAARLDIEIDGRLHDSLYDCLLTAKIYRTLLTEVLS